MNTYLYDSPIGQLLLASKGGELCYLGSLSAHSDWLNDEPRGKDPAIDSAIAWLDAYFAKRPYQFPIPNGLNLTPFQRRVYLALSTVPFGSTITYSKLGEMIGCSGARAIGKALHANPLLLIFPCHRVVAKNGLGGFALGIENKRYLLRHEGVSI